MASNSNIDLDFEGEFPPVKPLSSEELQNDRLVKRIKLQRKLEKLEQHDLSSENNKTISEYDNIDLDQSAKKVYKGTSGKVEDSGRSEKFKNFTLVNSNEAGLPDKKVGDTNKPDEKSLDGGKRKSNNKEEERQLKEQQRLRAERFKNFKLTDTGFDELIRQRELKNMGIEEHEPQQTTFEEKHAEIPEEFRNFAPTDHDLNLVRKTVMSQLVNKTVNFPNLLLSPTLIGKYNEVYRMFEHTIKDNEGHSALIIGPRSSGKTAIIQHALGDLSSKYPGQFITVNLNAYLHGDDVIALREVARQLDYNAKQFRSNEEVKFENFEQRSISDTFGNILSILDKNINNNNNNNNEQEAVSIIFIIDEFENFTSGNKQTLLYNLFDLSQNSSTPICVVGVSTKVTTRELLEKRVRSRFSQRIISINKASSIDEFWANAKLGLTLNANVIDSLNDKNYGLLWNKYIESLYLSSSSSLRKLTFQNYYATKNYKDFNNSCVFPITKLTQSQPFPNDNYFKNYLLNQSINSIQSIVESLSALELLLLIAATRWIEKFDLQVVNFNLAYKEYEEMVKNFNTSATAVNASSLIDSNILSNITINQKIWSPKILKNCWESLYKLGLLLDYGIVTSNSEGQVISTANFNRSIIIEDNKMVQLDTTLEELHHLIDDSNIYKSLTKL